VSIPSNAGGSPHTLILFGAGKFFTLTLPLVIK
jgi:hypothetical protein